MRDNKLPNVVEQPEDNKIKVPNNHINSEKSKDTSSLDVTTYRQKYDISYQLGAYYDMRYKEYFTRCRLILGLSRYNDDDTIFEREESIKEMNKFIYNFLLLWDMQQMNSQEAKSKYDDLAKDPVIQACGEMSMYVQEVNPYDKVLDELFLHTYPDLDKRELYISKKIAWTIWDIGTPYYCEIVARIIKDERVEWGKMFANIKDLEDTIQRLVDKGILFQEVNYTCNPDKNGNYRCRYDEPHIVLLFTKGPTDLMSAISETFVQMFKSFIFPRADYNS